MKNNCAARRAACALLLVFGLISLGSLASAQESPFVSEKLANLLRNEISGDRAYNDVRLLTPYHRIMGSRAFLDAAEALAALARQAGLTNVEIVKQKFEGGLSWDARSARLWLIEPEETKLCDFQDLTVSLAVFSRPAHCEAELVDIGRGETPEDFAGVDVAGKIVLTTAPPALAVRTAVWERGALGVVSSGSIHPEAKFDTPDQVAYIKVPVVCPAGKTPPWAFMISARRYGYLQDLLRKCRASKTTVRVRADIDTEIREPAEQAFLWADLPGASIHDQDIVLTAHLDEESTSANDNGSGCGAILEIGRAINALISQGRMPRPKRDIVFWWPNEHSSEYQYLRDHPEERKNWLANINLDMVGALQSMGSRVQTVIRTPWSLPSYLSDAVESLAEYVMIGNNGTLSSEEAGSPQPFSKPLLSFKGSRERYGVLVLPHSGGSDHEVFCESVVGVPGVALINYPDAYMHSSDDDLPNIDQTQLKRNAFITASLALFVANAGDEEVPMLAGEVYARGMRRLGADLGTAMGHLRDRKAGDYAASYREARNLLEQAAAREKKAVESALIFAKPNGANAAYARALAARIHEIGLGLVRDLDASYVKLSGEKRLPEPALTAEEKAMAGRIPMNTGTLDEYFGRRGWAVNFPGLHPIMAKECYCFVDGKHSYLDIYRAVHAEAMSGGSNYYGKVSAASVRSLLDQAVTKGVLKLKETQTVPASRAYVGHQSDADIKNFVTAYPKTAGTRLDDCGTCHRAGVKGTDTEREFSPCGYCHLLVYPNARFKTGLPGDSKGTLNGYGLDYLKSGRTAEALVSIATLDSDGDGFSNGEEIAALRLPGDPVSRPGQPLAPARTLSWDAVRKLAAHEQFMLMNTTKEPTDDYVDYRGVTVADLLKAAGVDLAGAAGITVFAPDGYSINYSLDDIRKSFPKGFFYAEPGKLVEAERSFVKYPTRLPAGVKDGAEIPSVPRLLLAYERDGGPLDPAVYEKGTGRLAGEGPYRLICPQRNPLGDPARPGRPDRSQKSKSYGDGWDFSPDIDHNAGFCVRGACVIRVNPMPPGFEEYDWKNGWPLIAARSVVVYGHGVK